MIERRCRSGGTIFHGHWEPGSCLTAAAFSVLRESTHVSSQLQAKRSIFMLIFHIYFHIGQACARMTL